MARAKLSWQEKLDLQDRKARAEGYPKAVEITGKLEKLWGRGSCAIAAPRDVDEIMKTVPKGRLITINQIRDIVARRQGATIG